MAFYIDGERKIRPGVYVRIVNTGDDTSMIPSHPATPAPGGSGDEKERALLFVTVEGILYPEGPALSLGDDGREAIVANAVNAKVSGETLVVRNPGS